MYKKDMRKRMNKRGQLTIFIIISLIIISGLLIYFLWIGPSYVYPEKGRLGFEKCVKEIVEENINNLGVNGGFIEPEFFINYKDEKIPYLCYTNLYYENCINQNPFLIDNFQNNLLEASEADIWACYESSLNTLKKQGYEIIEGGRNLSIELVPEKANIIIDAPIILAGEGSQRFTRFTLVVNSKIYEMLSLATSIIQFETQYGDSDVTSMMALYPDYAIDKFKQGDGATIYIIEDKENKNKFQFASRSLVLPPGYGQKSGLVR